MLPISAKEHLCSSTMTCFSKKYGEESENGSHHPLTGICSHSLSWQHHCRVLLSCHPFTLPLQTDGLASIQVNLFQPRTHAFLQCLCHRGFALLHLDHTRSNFFTNDTFQNFPTVLITIGPPSLERACSSTSFIQRASAFARPYLIHLEYRNSVSQDSKLASPSGPSSPPAAPQ